MDFLSLSVKMKIKNVREHMKIKAPRNKREWEKEREGEKEKRSVSGINLLPDTHFFIHSIALSTLFMETYSKLAHLYSPLHILHSKRRQNAEVHFHIAHTCGNHIECVCVCAFEKWVRVERENQTQNGIPIGIWKEELVRVRARVCVWKANNV